MKVWVLFEKTIHLDASKKDCCNCSLYLFKDRGTALETLEDFVEDDMDSYSPEIIERSDKYVKLESKVDELIIEYFIEEKEL